MDKIKMITKKIIDFREERDWKQFHKPKDLAISLCLETAEVLEHFQWKNEEELGRYLKTNKKHIGKELADVFSYILMLCYDLDIDIIRAMEDKIKENSKKYPVKKSKGNHIKYNKL